MKFKIVIVSVLVFLISCKSNYTHIGDKNANYIPYYLKVYEADSLYIVKEYGKSYKLLDSLFKKYEPLNQEGVYPPLREYGNYIKLKKILNKEINKNEFSKLTVFYGYKPTDILNDSILNIISNELQITEIDLKNMNNYYLNQIDFNLRKELNDIWADDQICRENISKIDKVSSNVRYNELKKIVLSTDSINSIKLKKIFKKYNSFPCPKYSGVISIYDDKWDEIYITEVLIHQSDLDSRYQRKYFLDFAYQELKKGRFNPVFYSMMNDRKYAYGNEMDYFMFVVTNSKISNIKIKEINKKRRLVGLPTVEYEKWKHKLLNL